METISRKQALEGGLRHYFTGKPCNKGHIDKRFTSIGKCMACAREEAMRQHTHTTDRRRAYSNYEGFVRAARELHGDTYLYDKAVYSGAHKRMTITCRVHGDFEQNPTNHMQGKGCPHCGTERGTKKLTKTLEAFIAQAQAVWGDVFDYSDTTYTQARVKLSFRCRAHNLVVEQAPGAHILGKNPCPQCNHMRSKGEDAVFSYLSFLTTAQQRDRTVIAPKELDIYLPEKDLAIEYCGMYWHSHGDKADEKAKRRNHINKYRECRGQGIRLLTIYEDEWLQRQHAIKRLLRNAVGKSRGRLMARKCKLRKVPHPEAVAFYEKYHPQGGAGNGEHYGLYWNDKLVACMRFTLGNNDRGAAAASRSWTLSRYATRLTVAGAASRLFKAFVKDQNPDKVKSFSDNRYFGGGMYQQLGFVLEEELPEDYQVWSPRLGLLPKPHYQRRVLPKRIAEHGKDIQFDPATDPRTEADITYAIGARRLYDCGKKRWVWTNKSR